MGERVSHVLLCFWANNYHTVVGIYLSGLFHQSSLALWASYDSPRLCCIICLIRCFFSLDGNKVQPKWVFYLICCTSLSSISYCYVQVYWNLLGILFYLLVIPYQLFCIFSISALYKLPFFKTATWTLCWSSCYSNSRKIISTVGSYTRDGKQMPQVNIEPTTGKLYKLRRWILLTLEYSLVTTLAINLGWKKDKPMCVHIYKTSYWSQLRISIHKGLGFVWCEKPCLHS